MPPDALPEFEARSAYMRIPGPVLLLFLVVAVLGLLTANPLLTAASILAIPIFVGLLWRPGEPPVLLLAVAFQWVQVTAKVFQANIEGVHVALLSEAGAVETAIWLSLAGLIVLSAGMRLGMSALGLTSPDRVREEIDSFSVFRVFVLYVGLAFFASVATMAAWSLSVFTQPLLAVASVKWVGFFLLGYVVLSRRSGYPLLALAVGIEFVVGSGFFAEFTTAMFLLLVVLFSVYQTIDVKTVSLGVVAIVAAILIGSVWGNVKEEYRDFLTEGERTQQVYASRTEQVTKLAELVTRQRAVDVVDGIEPLFDRLSYVDYFGFALDYVPQLHPHENGVVWGTALSHIFTPRVLFPQKSEILSDSEMTMYYTGLDLASYDEGTSISIGYMGESYIDFGRLGMFLPIMLLGLLWGGMYTYFVRRSSTFLIGFAIAAAVLMGVYQFEITGLKLLGGVVIKFLGFAVMLHLLERPLAGWLREGKPAPEPNTQPRYRYRPQPIPGPVWGSDDPTAWKPLS